MINRPRQAFFFVRRLGLAFKAFWRIRCSILHAAQEPLGNHIAPDPSAATGAVAFEDAERTRLVSSAPYRGRWLWPAQAKR
jgi:hypothetical protein